MNEEKKSRLITNCVNEFLDLVIFKVSLLFPSLAF